MANVRVLAELPVAERASRWASLFVNGVGETVLVSTASDGCPHPRGALLRTVNLATLVVEDPPRGWHHNVMSEGWVVSPVGPYIACADDRNNTIHLFE